MGPPPKPISTLAEFDARLQSLQRAADASISAEPGRIPMGQLFELARDFVAASPEEIEVLMDRPDHLPRVAAVSIMDFQARRKATAAARRRDLYDLYLRRHDRIDTWDLVDRAAPHVVGGYLWDKSREPLYGLAASPHWYERRTSIVSTWFFIRRGDLDDTFRIAEIIANDPEDLVQKAVGGWIREAGKRDEQRLRDFSIATPRQCLALHSATRANICRLTLALITSIAGRTLKRDGAASPLSTRSFPPSE